MDPLTLSLIMGGTGLLKSEIVDRPKEDRQRWLASQTQRYSPWTGLKAGEIQEADPFGSAMQGGVQGYAQGQNFKNADAGMKLQEAQASYLNGMSSDAGMEGIPMGAGAKANSMSSMDTRSNPYKLSRMNFGQ